MKTLVACLLAACLLPVFAAEEIRDFSSRIEVLPDSDLLVTETIRVMPEGDQIQHGIFRDFPTIYHGGSANRVTVPFEVLETLRDGKPEPRHIEKESNGVRIYLGSKNVFLPREETTYTIKYRTGRQLGFFKDFDGLYWNVTGNGWTFPIRHASVHVDLPAEAAPLSIDTYVGREGSTCSASGNSSRPGEGISLETVAPLQPGEGFTVAITWPKGFVTPPTETPLSHLGAIAGTIGILIVFGYFFVSWRLVGRDPARGSIIPLFEPPKGFTPQDVRYLDGLGTCDQTSLAAAVMHLAVQRVVSIRPRGKSYCLQPLTPPVNPDPEQSGLYTALFPHGSSLELEQSNHRILQSASNRLAKDLSQKIGRYFSRNTRVWVIGFLATLIALGISLFDAENTEGTFFLMIWVGVWSLGCFALLRSLFTSWKSPGKKLAAIPLAFFSVLFLGAWGFGMWSLIQASSLWVFCLCMAGITLCRVFHHLLKRPTPEGQHLRDQILGFKKYLSVAEAERLDLENPPERTPELFEKFLPYALALGVEQKWSEQFSDVLAAASRDLESGNGTTTAFALPLAASGFTSSFGSAIASASTAPGSSSGSGGSGSSGGGGGGGGGGGW